MERLNITLPRPKRLPLGKVPRKRNLSPNDISYLFMHKVIVEEQMDGKPIKFISTDPQLFIFAEDLKQMRETYYHIPGRYAIFDIFDPARDLFLCWEDKLSLSMEIRKGRIRVSDVDPLFFFPVPQVAYGKFRMDELPRFIEVSAYAREYGTSLPAPGKGIIVKSSAEEFPEFYHPGKIVWAEFRGENSGHRQKMPFRENTINPAAAVADFILCD
jgi:hypothetical protein